MVLFMKEVRHDRYVVNRQDLTHPLCWGCGGSRESLRALQKGDSLYCKPCWQSYLRKRNDSWEAMELRLVFAIPSSCPECKGPGPLLSKTEDGSSRFCKACWGEVLPPRALHYPSPLLPMPRAPPCESCKGMVASNYCIVAKNFGIGVLCS